MDKQYFVAYLPYIFLGETEEINFGFGKVWNFDKKKREYIPDVVLRKKLERILNVYRSGRDRVGGIGIISLGEIDFRVYSEDERELVRHIRMLLFLISISKNNTHRPGPNVGHLMRTSENFDVIYQNFILKNDYASETAGSIVQRMIGGYKLSEIRVQIPSFVLTPNQSSIDSDLLRSLLELRKKKKIIYKRVIAATEIFLESYYNSHHVSKNARILLQACVFEILLNLPTGSAARKNFKKSINKYFVTGKEKKYNYITRISVTKKLTESLTKKEIWADKFFSLRNNIAHADRVRATDFYFGNSQTHADVSLLFFILFLRKQIERSLPKYPCYIAIDWNTWTDNLSRPKVMKRSGFVYDQFTGLFLQKIRRGQI